MDRFVSVRVKGRCWACGSTVAPWICSVCLGPEIGAVCVVCHAETRHGQFPHLVALLHAPRPASPMEDSGPCGENAVRAMEDGA